MDSALQAEGCSVERLTGLPPDWGSRGPDAAATVELPRAAALAVARRRRPWDGARLAEWQEQARREVRVERLSAPTDRPRRGSPAA